MRTFLKPFLLAMLALGMATSLTRIVDARCTHNTERAIVAFADNKTVCAPPTTVWGLYPRGTLARRAATIFGVVVPLSLLAVAFLMVIGLVAGRVSVFAASVLSIIGGTFLVASTVAQYNRWHALFGSPDFTALWLHHPLTPRDAVIWLASGLFTGGGLWLLATALQRWRRRVMLK